MQKESAKGCKADSKKLRGRSQEQNYDRATSTCSHKQDDSESIRLTPRLSSKARDIAEGAQHD